MDAEGRVEIALADLSEAVRLMPGDPRGYKARGGVYLRQTKLDLALRDAEEAVRLGPADSGSDFLRESIMPRTTLPRQ